MMQRGRNWFVSADRAAVAAPEPGKHGYCPGLLLINGNSAVT